MRGLRPVDIVFLKAIMEEVKIVAQLETVPEPSDYFGLIEGTSTGGLIALLLGPLEYVSCLLKLD
jgi:patatin-like phospholipase/acyl hydrolase